MATRRWSTFAVEAASTATRGVRSRYLVAREASESGIDEDLRRGRRRKISLAEEEGPARSPRNLAGGARRAIPNLGNAARVLAFLCAAAAAAPAAVAPERTCAVHESPHHVLLNTPKWRGGHPLAPPDVAPLHLAPITTAAELLSSTSSSNQPSVVFFCASWCTPCVAAQRVVDAAAAEPWGALGLAFLRADGAALDSAALHNVTELPALAFYDGRGGNATAHLSWRAAPALPEVLRFVKAQLRAHAAASRASREVLLAEWVAGRPKAPRSSRGRVASAANLLANDAPPIAAARRQPHRRRQSHAPRRRAVRSRSALQLLDWVAGKPEQAASRAAEEERGELLARFPSSNSSLNAVSGLTKR